MVIADDASPLKPYMMKPFPHRGLSKEQRVCNYRFSRARRVVENGFGILENRFWILLTTIFLSPKVVGKVVLAYCTLHNFLRAKESANYTPPGFLDEDCQLYSPRFSGRGLSTILLPVFWTRTANYTPPGFLDEDCQLYSSRFSGRGLSTILLPFSGRGV